jgi:hypothetical protein
MRVGERRRDLGGEFTSPSSGSQIAAALNIDGGRSVLVWPHRACWPAVSIG